MPSSTSSSRPRWLALAHLAFAFWVCAAASAFAFLFRPAAAPQADIVTHRDPPSDDEFYLAHDRGGHIDHHVIYHGIDRVVRERLRAADVLFLGNSRLMFALDPTTLAGFFVPLGLQYYVLGFGHEEQDDFPLQIIRDNDLRPSLVVVNADLFFAGRRSEWAARVIEESDFDAWKVQFEGETAHRVRRALHRIVPHYVDLGHGHREVVLYRSRENGTWFVANEFADGSSFAWPPGDRTLPGVAARESAAAFKREVEARGARLVLCLVPGPDVSLHRARAFAEQLSVPMIVPNPGALRTIDNSHLSPDSARRVASDLLGQLRAHLPRVEAGSSH
jgi:hypothetical protein